jgi:uncharacterized protein YjbJ (UPF0337 family)
MNWDTIKGNWNELKGTAKTRWAKLTDDDLQQIDGDRDRLVGKLQQYYGMTREAAEHEINQTRWH